MAGEAVMPPLRVPLRASLFLEQIYGFTENLSPSLHLAVIACVFSTTAICDFCRDRNRLIFDHINRSLLHHAVFSSQAIKFDFRSDRR
jgi:hypothetical protein